MSLTVVHLCELHAFCPKNFNEVNKPDINLTGRLQCVITIKLWNVNFLRCRNRLETFSLCGKLLTSFQLTVSFTLPSPVTVLPYSRCCWTKFWCPEAKYRQTQHCRFSLEQADQTCYDFLAIHTVYSSLNRPFSPSRYYWLTLVNGLSRIRLSTLLSSPFYPSLCGWWALVYFF